MFVSKAEIKLKVRGFTRVGSRIECKYQTRMEVTDSDKHTSLFRNKITCNLKMFLLYDNEYTSIIDIYFYEYFL